jgi:hypothetical protein
VQPFLLANVRTLLNCTPNSVQSFTPLNLQSDKPKNNSPCLCCEGMIKDIITPSGRLLHENSALCKIHVHNSRFMHSPRCLQKASLCKRGGNK